MIVYNVTGLDHAVIRDQAEAAYDKGNISAGEFSGIMAAFPATLYSPNFFIRIGLFLLTTVISICALGLMFLLFMTIDFIGGVLLFFGGCAYSMLELWWIKEKDHFRSGIDDALIWISGISVLTGFMLVADLDPGTSAGCAFTCVAAAWMAVRFADMIMALIAFAAGIACIFFLGFEISPVVADLMPFIIMAAAFGGYRWFERMRGKEKLRHYKNSLTVLSAAALITLYMAGNYFVVRELGASMLGKTGPVPVGWLFWILTFAIPLVYICLGIRRKHRILLRSGLILLGMAVFTVRYYHSLMPLESAMILGGVVLIVAAWAVIRYLKQPRGGFTYEADGPAEEMTGLKAAEAIIIAQTFHKTPQPGDPFKFGGGTGGGGGASGEY